MINAKTARGGREGKGGGRGKGEGKRERDMCVRETGMCVNLFVYVLQQPRWKMSVLRG